MVSLVLMAVDQLTAFAAFVSLGVAIVTGHVSMGGTRLDEIKHGRHLTVRLNLKIAIPQ